MSNKKKKSRIPEFKSYEEEAEFWDTHDFTDFDDEFKPVEVRVSKNLSSSVAIRLDPESLERIRQLAHDQGIGPTTLIRIWVLEHLKGAGEH